MKEIKEDKNKWKDSLCSLMERTNIVKMSNYPKKYTDSTQSYQNSNGILYRN
jgi:hypothetical protein